MPYKNKADAEAWRLRYQETKNSRRRERYASDPIYREKILSNKWKPPPAKQREYEKISKERSRLRRIDKIQETQNNLCAICHKPERQILNGKLKLLNQDHDHESGRLRGFLCMDCNTGLGKFHDNVEYLKSAIEYLILWRTKDGGS
jgi:hypothetical protein